MRCGNASFNYYDRLGRAVATRDAENYVTETAYNVFGEVTSVTRRYNRANNPASAAALPTYVAHANDATTRFDYDRLGNVVKTTDAEGHYEQYTLDAFGQQVSVRNKLGGVRRTLRPARAAGRRRRCRCPRPTATAASGGDRHQPFEYDARGNRTKKIEAFGLAEQRTTTYVYDKADRLVETRGDAVTILSQSDHYTQATVTPTERFKYDRRGNLIEASERARRADALLLRPAQPPDRRASPPLGTLHDLQPTTRTATSLTARVYATPVALPGDGRRQPAGAAWRRVSRDQLHLRQAQPA